MNADTDRRTTAPAADAQAGDGTAVILQAASVLLSYPAEGGEDDLEVVAAAMAESRSTPARRHLERFLAWYRRLDGGERERAYVATFDLGARHSLYLTEAGPRTSRERGAALLELRRAYRRAGLDVRTSELPDYVPLMLEAAALAPACRELLAGRRTELRRLARGLERDGSLFASVVEAVLAVTPAGDRRGSEEGRDER